MRRTLRGALLVVFALLGASCLPQVGPRLDAGEPPIGGGSGADAGAQCDDGVLDGAETDVDCGGGCVPCADGQRCASAVDCSSGRCSATTCVAPASTCAAAFAGCTNPVDLTATVNPTIRFPVGGDRYAPDCVRVRLGQSVTFEGSFGPHPLSQACGPVGGLLEASNGSALTVRFDQALGAYGFYCTRHGSPGGSGMAGAIEVVP